MTRSQTVVTPVVRVLRSVRRPRPTGQPDGGPEQQPHDPPGGQPDRPRGRANGRRRWAAALLGVCAVGLGVRLAHVHANAWDDIAEVQTDAAYYHLGANLLAEGHGFVHPLYFHWYGGLEVAGADHPPGYIAVLAVPSWLGWDDLHSHLVVSSLIGAGTVAAIGLLGRRVGGPRVGLLAAGFAAVYPNLWLVDGALMSETVALLVGVALTLAVYRAWDRPDPVRFAVVGALLGLSWLVRAEAAVLAAVLVVPLAVWAPGLHGWAVRLRRAALANLVALAVVAPWAALNVARFEHPTVSTGLGTELAGANCDDVYSGPYLGFWSFGCQVEADAGDPRFVDRSEMDRVSRERALRYVGDNLDRLPAVVGARIGRTFGLYTPLDQLDLDRYNDLRPPAPARVGLGAYYLAVAAGVAGAIALRRRRVPIFPLTAWFLGVAVTVAGTHGQTRYRAPAEPSLVVLAAVGLAVGLAHLWDRLRRRDDGDEGDEGQGGRAATAAVEVSG